jgi:hypothetical protein
VPNVEIAASDCQLDQYGRRAPLTESRLVSVIQQGIAGFGAKVSIDQVRMLVQADLNRSGDDEKIKAEVLSELQSAYQPNSAPGLALSKPFDLNDSGMVYANGYDPCGNPGAIGGGRGVGSAFGQGPFASDFATINPVPVVAARTQATTEGGAI